MKRTAAWIACLSVLLMLTGCEPGEGAVSSDGNESNSSHPSQGKDIPESGMNMKGFEFVIQDMTSENGKVTVSTPTLTSLTSLRKKRLKTFISQGKRFIRSNTTGLPD